jgi:molecular chaperone GrpE
MAEDKAQHEREVAEDLDELPGIDGTPPDDVEPHEGSDATPDKGEAAQQHSPDDLLTRVQQERDELEQRLMRIAADYENYKKRALRNVTEAEEQTLMDVGRGLVTVMDHFDRALDVDPDKANTRDVLSGLKIVHDELLAALAKFGITRVEARPGDPFDPNRHEAMMRTEAEDIEADHVVQQFQPGYAIKDKTIRPAQVSVAS